MPMRRRCLDPRRLAPVAALVLSLGLVPFALGGGPAAADEVAPPRPGPLLLVSQSEIAALPLDVPVARSTTPTSEDGPEIRIASPTHNATYEGPFPIKVEFLPGPKGHPVDLESLRLEYKRAWGIDITDRVRDYIHGTAIDVAESELPRGRHTVEIQIADVEENLSRRIFTVVVK